MPHPAAWYNPQGCAATLIDVQTDGLGERAEELGHTGRPTRSLPALHALGLGLPPVAAGIRPLQGSSERPDEERLRRRRLARQIGYRVDRGQGRDPPVGQAVI
jgi:hypothetical protein